MLTYRGIQFGLVIPKRKNKMLVDSGQFFTRGKLIVKMIFFLNHTSCLFPRNWQFFKLTVYLYWALKSGSFARIFRSVSATKNDNILYYMSQDISKWSLLKLKYRHDLYLDLKSDQVLLSQIYTVWGKLCDGSKNRFLIMSFCRIGRPL